jgi:hypothetical protein
MFPKSAIDLSGSMDLVNSVKKTRQKAGIGFIFFCLCDPIVYGTFLTPILDTPLPLDETKTF